MNDPLGVCNGQKESFRPGMPNPKNLGGMRSTADVQLLDRQRDVRRLRGRLLRVQLG